MNQAMSEDDRMALELFPDIPKAEAQSDADGETLAAVEALESVIEWLEGPQGPDVLFDQGVKMKLAVQAAIAKYRAK